MPFGIIQWGIFDQSGFPVLAADSFGGIELQNDYRISDYPQEQGAFESYNKVKIPFQSKVTFFVRGNKAGFLSALDMALAALTLYTIVTPDASYPSTNLTHYNYRRVAQSGVSMMRVEVWFEEVRVIGAGSLSNTQSTNGAATQNNGSAQPQNWQQNIAATPPT